MTTEQQSIGAPPTPAGAQTHAVTKPNQRPPTPLEVFKLELHTNYLKQVQNYLNGNEQAANKFMSAVVYSVQKVPGLLECDKTSLAQAFMSAAEFGLYPGSVSGEAYVLPYKGKAQFQIGYQGLITLLWRAGISVNSQIVREKDEFAYEEGQNPRLEHRPDPFSTERGEAIGVYAVATLPGTSAKLAKVMGKDEVMKFKEFSQAKGSSFSPWNSANDPELWMWKKTCIKQLAKTLPKTEVLQRAIAIDNEDSTVGQSMLDAAGPGVGAALHDPKNL